MFDLNHAWQDNSKAARLLAEHGQVTAAVRRLMQPLNQAAKAGQPVNPTWADKETLSLLYTYRTSLNSDWALQQVTTAPQQSCRLVLQLPCLHGVYHCCFASLFALPSALFSHNVHLLPLLSLSSQPLIVQQPGRHYLVQWSSFFGPVGLLNERFKLENSW